MLGLHFVWLSCVFSRLTYITIVISLLMYCWMIVCIQKYDLNLHSTHVEIDNRESCREAQTRCIQTNGDGSLIDGWRACAIGNEAGWWWVLRSIEELGWSKDIQSKFIQQHSHENMQQQRQKQQRHQYKQKMQGLFGLSSPNDNRTCRNGFIQQHSNENMATAGQKMTKQQ